MTGAVHGFLRGDRPDGRGRRLADVLAFDDDALEATHDFIQWLFPLAEASRAVLGAPVLAPGEAAAIRADAQALSGFRAGLDRMRRFYAETEAWLAGFDHNHLRITRILTATRALLGDDEARAVHASLLARVAAAGTPVNARSLRFWDDAVR